MIRITVAAWAHKPRFWSVQSEQAEIIRLQKSLPWAINSDYTDCNGGGSDQDHSADLVIRDVCLLEVPEDRRVSVQPVLNSSVQLLF